MEGEKSDAAGVLGGEVINLVSGAETHGQKPSRFEGGGAARTTDAALSIAVGEKRSSQVAARIPWRDERSWPVNLHYPGIAIVLAAVAAFSALAKLRRDRKVVHVVHEVVGVPFKYFPHLAVCEFAGALGLVLGIWWRPLGIAAGIGLVVYFVGAVVAHLRVADMKGMVPAAVILVLCVVALALRIMQH